MILIVTLLTILLLSYLKFWLGRRRLCELAAKLPSPKGYPLIGHAHIFLGNTQDILITLNKLSVFAQQHDGFCNIWLGPVPYVVLTNPADIEIVLNSCLQKDRSYKFIKPCLGNGLLTGPVPIWKRHRRMLVPAFNQKILDGFMDIFWNQSNILIKNMKSKVGESPFDAYSFISVCTLDIICETAMGVTMNAQEDMDVDYLHAMVSQMSITYSRMFKIWLQPDFLFNLTPYKKLQDQNLKIVHALANEVISKKRQNCDSQKNYIDSSLELKETYPKPFLDLMMNLSDNDQKLTDLELREEVDTMIVAGYDTSASAICFVLMMIGSYPSVQEKVMAELNDIFGNSKRKITKEDLTKMHYLERVIKETLRLYPIAPIVLRVPEKEVQLTTATLPAGIGCAVSVWGLHRDKSIWGEDVEVFDPDRFLPERFSKQHRCSYIPFSYGVRNCIGRQYAMMSMKILLSNILQNYRIKSDPNIPIKAEIFVKPVHGYYISIQER